MASILLIMIAPLLAQTETSKEAFFEARIRPVLAKSCFKCHGEATAEHGLRVDSRRALIEGGSSGAALVPEHPDRSLVIQALRYTHDDIRMPPDRAMPDRVVADFERWVAGGAVWPEKLPLQKDGTGGHDAIEHWAFQPITKTHPPNPVKQWSDHPIDRFVSKRWQEQKLRPVAQSDPRTLLRRIYYDLLGLPPTPHEIGAYEEALRRHPQTAWNRLIDRLLSSPRYGERWGRHWMDVVRYADTAGDNADYPVPEARLYRDYIIDAFNANLPYDQFVREQLAGDILARQDPGDRYADQIVATGFLALSRRFGTAPYELWHLTLEDTIDTTGRALMGLTLKCARCHDHKFDPVTTRDYYALYGMFDSTQFPWAGGEEYVSMKRPRRDFVPLLADNEAAPVMAAHRARLDDLQNRINDLNKRLEACDESATVGLREQLARLEKQHLGLRRSSLPPDVPGAYAVAEGNARDVRLQAGGDPGRGGEIVPRNAIAFLANRPLDIPEGQSGRLQLARWLTQPNHPLFARVMVNRIWQHHFGNGIVATPSNFGASGASPTHPQLLDFLARKFVESGFRIKRMHRLILTSKTWQLASDTNEDNAEIDPDNNYYWRHDRRRLDAECIRDTMLSASGALDLNRPASHPFPPIEEWRWTQHKQFKDRYDSQHRSVYLMTQRIQRHPFLALFDGPDTNTTTATRTEATVTPQSLYLMNSVEMKRVAGDLGTRLMGVSADSRKRIEIAYQLCFARAARQSELKRDQAYIRAHLREVSSTAPDDAEREAWTSYSRLLLSSNEFFYLD
jgi:hypothetical protein